MSRKNKPDSRGFVFSTDPNFRFGDEAAREPETLPAAQQRLRVRLDTKQRAGKMVTLVEGFTGSGDDLESLGKQIKNHCGTGGAVKEGAIIVQGDHRDKVLQWLQKSGYKNAKKN